MSEILRSRARRSLEDVELEPSVPQTLRDEGNGDIDAYSKEVLNALIKANLPPTPTNFSLYFDRLLENKSKRVREQINSILESEESNENESNMLLEQNLKQGFSSIKNILSITANLYKNLTLMTKILDQRKDEFKKTLDAQGKLGIAESLEIDIEKLNTILKTQNISIKNMYDETATIVKTVDTKTIFDNQYGIYNKRYLISKIEQECDQVEKFKHKSTLIMIELSKELKDSIRNDKAILLMTKTVARLLLKTSRRSDIVAHYGDGIFGMLLRHTDIECAKKASERLSDLVSNSTFFLADKELQLKIAIGITDVTNGFLPQEIIFSALNAIEKSYENPACDYAVVLKDITAE